MHGPSSFIDTAAVEAWDAWFRWRERDRLHDIAVEATWQRVAKTLASAELMQPIAEHESALMSAFASWRLLLDERIFATAGTHAAIWPNNDLVAVLNASMFVREPFSTRARFDTAAFGATAELAVAALDNATSLGSGPRAGKHRLRIGIIGLADALALLDLRYDSEAGRVQGGEIARVLAEGCFRGALRSARDRGCCGERSTALLDHAVERAMPAELLDEARHRGLRHAQLTAITSQPRLALFANNVANALDPLGSEDRFCLITTPEQTRTVRSSGYASTIRRTLRAISPKSRSLDTSANLPFAARIAMRRAIQPWIDEPIDPMRPGMGAADDLDRQILRRPATAQRPDDVGPCIDDSAPHPTKRSS